MSGAREPLAVLERLRALELEQAQAERSALDVAVARRREELDTTRVEIQRAQAVLRDRAASTEGISADTLRRDTDYLSWQGQVGTQQEAALASARELAEEARVNVVKRHGELRAVERLRERRRRAAVLELGRVTQRQLDEQGLLRARVAARN